jgi:uncharacterized iron-regulated membrane protein
MKTSAMQTKRFWLELVGLCAGIACALAFLIATLGAAAAGAAGASTDSQQSEPPLLQQDPTPHVAPQPAPQQPNTEAALQTYAGMVTCSRCGARHSANLGKSATDCTRACVHAGAGFSLVDGEKTYILDGDLTLLQEFAGQRARIVGAINGNRIRVTSVASET